MSIFKRLENHYKSKSYLTYHAANEHEQLLLFYPNYKSTKIYVIHKSDDSKWFDLGCLERGDVCRRPYGANHINKNRATWRLPAKPLNLL